MGINIPKARAFLHFVDPEVKAIKDWNWRPLHDVAKQINIQEVPEYIQKGYGDFMLQQAAKAAANQLSPRDLLKAYTITQSSIGRKGLRHSTATKAGLQVPKTDELVRPEGAFAEWLGSQSGQRYLDMAEQGEVDPAILQEVSKKFAPFGKQNVLADSMRYGVENLPQLSKDMNSAVTGSQDAYRDWAEQMNGIAGAKSGFVGSMLGRGDLPTLDARQVTLHTNNESPVGFSSLMNRQKGLGAREAVDRLAARQAAMNLGLDQSLDPFYQHLAHHAIWDKAENSQTTHDDLVRAMLNYKAGGLV